MNLNFFGPGSPYLGHPLLTAERTAAEVDVILRQFGLLGPAAAEGLEVVDVGCGFGRHAIEFAQRGANVVAIDPSATMIEAATNRAAEANQHLSIDWRVAAGETIDDRDRFDVALCLFTTFGQLRQAVEADESEKLLNALMTAVRPGGHIVIEVPERQRAIEMLVESERLGPEGNATEVTRRFDPATSVLHERFTTATDDSFDLAYRLFSSAELVELCAAAGFVDIVTIDQALVPPPPTFVTLFASCPSG